MRKNIIAFASVCALLLSGMTTAAADAGQDNTAGMPPMYYSGENVYINEDGVLIIADYSEYGRLVNVKTQAVSQEDVIAVPSKSCRKLMLWDSLDTANPLCDAIYAQSGGMPTGTPSTDIPTPSPAAATTDTPAYESPTPTDEPNMEAYLYAVYTTDGTEDGEILRTKLIDSTAGDTVSLPQSAFAARKLTSSDGTFDVYSYVSGGTGDITLKSGENSVYITVKREDGKFYYWEDFEDRDPGAVPENDIWYHGGASTSSDFIRCTTDETDSTTAVRWYSKSAGGGRDKTFVLLDSVPDIPDGEKLVFSADVRLSQTASSKYDNRLHFYSEDGTEIMRTSNFKSLKTKIYTLGSNEYSEISFSGITGTEEEVGWSSSASLSKWFNVQAVYDPSLGKNTITIDEYGKEDSLYCTEISSDVLTKIMAHLARGSATIIMDNIKVYNTSAEYTAPAKAELAAAAELYGNRNLSRYSAEGTAEYSAVVVETNELLSAADVENGEYKSMKNKLITAANALREIAETDGERIRINEDYDWIFIKEKECQSTPDEISTTSSLQLPMTGWTLTDVPHTWNAQDGSDGVSGYDRGNGWYRKSMYVDDSYEGRQVYLEFEGAAYKTRLYVNGTPVPFSYDDPYLTADEDGVEYTHRGGFSTFRFDITNYVKYGAANEVAVVVDNSQSLETLPLGGDFSKEGGMYRDVTMVITNPVHIDMLDNGSGGMYLTPQKATDVTDDTNKDFNLNIKASIVNNTAEDRDLTITAELREPSSFELPDSEYIKKYLQFDPETMYTPGGRTVKTFAEKTVTVKAGESLEYNETELVESPHLWNGVKDPYMYEVNLKVYDGDTLVENMTDNVGFRYFRTPTPTKYNTGGGFYLNGEKYLLKGVGKHQDYGRGENALGIAVTDKERTEDAAVIYELGANALRLVHYQHSKREIEIYDKLGFIVWSEPALCSAMVWNGAEAYSAFEKTTLNQFEAMIKQQYNDPSVIFWAFSNEITHILNDNGDKVESKYSFQESFEPLTRKMQETAKALDPVRITTYATNALRSPEAASDITGVNRYPYWYLSTTSAKKVMENTYKNVKANNGGIAKPVCLSEYGGAGVAGITNEYNADGSVSFLGTSQSSLTSSTTYQAYLHEKAWSELFIISDGPWGSFVWQMFDSANDSEDVNLGGMNTKGLVSYDHSTRKAAYYMYKANWNNFEPFVYIVNTERSERPDVTTIIRAYSNADECQLYLNGEKYGEPITDTNPNDAVPDGNHTFVWYDIPMSGNDTVEIRGIKDGKEIASSVDTNSEVIFTCAFGETSVKSLSELLTVNEDGTVTISGGVDKVKSADVTDKLAVSTLADSDVTLLNPDGTAVTDEFVSEGMIIRVTGKSGAYEDHKIIAGALAMTAAASSNESDAGHITDGGTCAVWKAETNSDEYIILDLSAEYNVNQADIYLGNANPYKICVSSDGESYSEYLDGSENSKTDISVDMDGVSARYIKIEFPAFRLAAEVREVNVYGWRFNNTGNYTIDESEKKIWLGESTGEHDTAEVSAKLLIDGQASYEFTTQEDTGRVLADGDSLVLTPKYGKTVTYTMYTRSK